MRQVNIPLVSIIMPCYNSSKTVSKAIKSVIEQTYTNWELLITDDCSKDQSREIIKSYSDKDNRIKLYTLEENMGVANARNNSMADAKGTYIAFLDSDDKWHSEKLEIQINYMLQNNIDFSYTAYKKINNEDIIISDKIKVRETGIAYKDLLKHNEMGCLTIVINNKLIEGRQFQKVGHEDYVFWLSILKTGVKSYGINKVLSYYRVGNESISSNKLKAMGFTWNIYRNIEGLDFLKSSYYFLHYAFNSFLKSFK